MKFLSGEIVTIWPVEYADYICGAIIAERYLPDVYDVLADEKIWMMHHQYIGKDKNVLKMPSFDELGKMIAQKVADEIDALILRDLEKMY